MKVMQINTFFYNGGSTGRIVYELAEEMLQSGIVPVVAYGVGLGEQDTEYSWRMESSLYKKINNGMGKLLGNHGFHSLRATRKLISRIEYERPDIIHLHNLHGGYLHVGLLFEHLKKVVVL